MINETYLVPIQIMRELLKDRNLKAVAARTGLSYSTVRKAVTGSDKTTVWTIIKLSDYLVRQHNMLCSSVVDDLSMEYDESDY